MKKDNVRASHLTDIADSKDGTEEVLSLLTPASGSSGVAQSVGTGANPLDVQNPVAKDNEPSNEHRTMAAPPRWKGDQKNRTVR
jgi:hypothetical protein